MNSLRKARRSVKTHIGLAGDGELLPGAVKPGAVKGLDVIDLREIGRPEVVRAVRSVEIGMGHDLRMQRFGMEIVQAANGRHDAVERCGDPRLRDVGDVVPAFDYDSMQFGMKGPRDLSGRAVEADPVARPRYLLHGEPARLQPGGDQGQIVLAQPEAFSILLGSEPVAVIGR